MGRKRKLGSPKAMGDMWDEYKAYCDSQNVLTHDFSSKNSEFVSASLKRSMTYTIEGFCVWAGIARSKFYQTYGNDPRYGDIVERMKDECEVDARKKFELGIIPPQLAPLWMSKHGYSIKTDNNVNGYVPVMFEGGDQLED